MSGILGAVVSTDFKRCAFYGRYSTKMQRPASLEDQLRSCREFTDEVGWYILDEHIYQDAAITGTSKANRKGLEALETAAQNQPRPFDYVLFDDTSRLGRNQADVLNFVALMAHYSIAVRFVSQKLDSRDPSFSLLLNMHSMIDTQYITRLRAKIFSGQKGRVLAGFHVGSIPYGYETQLIDANDDPGAIGRAATQGTKLKVIESEAKVIRYIFELFSDGRSIWNICVRLNRDRVPSPQNAMAGKKGSEWGPDAIKRILRNPKYIGWNIWNASEQKEHPVTGKITKEDKPAHEHIKAHLEEIRIVSDELWERAQARLRLLAEKQDARRLGGYNRAKKQEYLYSGLLFCGSCGARMTIGGVQGSSRYECPKHRRGEDCTNGLTIREAQASAQITEALANQLFTPECLEHLIPAVYSELQAAWQREQDSVSKEQVPELERELRDCLGKIDNLIDRIEKGGSESLGDRLELRELERDRLRDKLTIAKRKKRLPITKQELHTLVQENVANLHAVLKSDVHLARKILFRLVNKLVLNPGVFEGRPMFTVVGEIDLLGQPGTQKDGVLLGCLGTQTPQQHTDCYFFFCILLDPNPDECPLIQPLYELLTSEPALGLEPRTPSDWAERLRATLPDNGGPKRPFGYGAIARCFRIHRHLLEQRFDFVKVKNPVNIGHLYQLSIREASRLG